MPIKRIGVDTGAGSTPSTLALATSEAYVELLARALSVPESSVVVTGLPRNDILVRSALTAVPAQPEVCWLPTYRKTSIDAEVVDGTDFGNPFNLPDIDCEMVDAIFGACHVRGWMSLHPLSARSATFHGLSFEIQPSPSKESLYERLGRSAALITDFSSVWIDYLLIDRPIIFVLADWDEYEKTRGTYLHDLNLSLPGPIVRNADELSLAVRQVADGSDPFASDRRTVRDALHLHQDDGSSQRVMRIVDMDREHGRSKLPGFTETLREDLVALRSAVDKAWARRELRRRTHAEDAGFTFMKEQLGVHDA